LKGFGATVLIYFGIKFITVVSVWKQLFSPQKRSITGVKIFAGTFHKKRLAVMCSLPICLYVLPVSVEISIVTILPIKDESGIVQVIILLGHIYSQGSISILKLDGRIVNGKVLVESKVPFLLKIIRPKIVVSTLLFKQSNSGRHGTIAVISKSLLRESKTAVATYTQLVESKL